MFGILLFSRRRYVFDIFSEVTFYIYLSIGFNHSAFALRNEGRLQNSPYFSKHIPRGELIELLSKALLYLEVESHWRNDELTTKCKSGFSLLEPHVCSLDASATKSAQSGAMELNDSSVAGGSSVTTLAHKSTTNTSQASFETGSLRETLPLHEQVLLKQSQTLAPAVDALSKRKNSPVLIDGPAEKRARRGSPDMDIDVNSDCNFSSLCRKLALINIAAVRARSPFPDNLYYNGRQVALNRPTYHPYLQPLLFPNDQSRHSGVALRLVGHKSEVGFIATSNVAILKMTLSNDDLFRCLFARLIRRCITCWLLGTLLLLKFF